MSVSFSIFKDFTLCLEEFEDTKGVIRIRISKKNRQNNGQKKKYKRTNNAHKTKDRVTRTPLKIGGELKCSGRVSSSCSTRICYCKYSFISFLLIIDVQNFTDDLFYIISLTCLLWMGLTFNTFKYMYNEFCLIICALLL
jgi:hypothetical protein